MHPAFRRRAYCTLSAPNSGNAADTSEPASDLERLIADLSQSGPLVFVFGDGFTTAHLAGATTPEFGGPAGRRPAWYVFVVAFPAAEVPALTALIRQAYDSGDAVGMSVAGKLWQAPRPRRKFVSLRAEQINLLSRNQAFQPYRLLVPPG